MRENMIILMPEDLKKAAEVVGGDIIEGFPDDLPEEKALAIIVMMAEFAARLDTYLFGEKEEK